MKNHYIIASALIPIVSMIAAPVTAETGLRLVYPPADHQTTADRIFFIGTAAPELPVTINGQVISQRSSQGNFAPSLPLVLGENTFTLQQQDRSVQVTVTRVSNQPFIAQGMTLDTGSLTPSRSLARLPGELICLGAIAPPGATVTVQLANQTLALNPVLGNAQLPPNYAVLTGLTQPTPALGNQHQGCLVANTPGNLGEPQFQLSLNGQTNSQAGNGNIQILSPESLEVVEVTSEQGAARTGASTDFSRITPLPRGTRAIVTGREEDWVRLDYGGWIRSTEVKVIPNAALPLTTIRGITSRIVPGATEIIFPLETAVPLSVQQGDRTFTLTLFNTTAQTDTIRLDDNPIISRLDWQQAAPGRVDYTFSLKNSQQWGYSLRYEGTSLILRLRHPPALRSRNANDPQSLAGVRILLDPGHGDTDLGALGPTGYPEKDINLLISQMLRAELEKKGAMVVMTRDRDVEIPLAERVAQINNGELTLALSLHYNALPDDGDAQNTQGISAFWYHPQAHSLAVFLHNYLTQQLDRPSYGIYWNNLALTRPQATPTVLLELGFMINPEEFEWITNPESQQKLAGSIAEGVNQWLYQSVSP